MNGFQVTGDKTIDRFLTKLPEAFRREALLEAAKPSAQMIRDEAKKLVKPEATDGQSKAAYLQRNIRALRSKSKKNIGYNIYIKGKDIPVGNKFWTISGYGVLYGEGSYKTGKRTTKKGANRGRFMGKGNFIYEAGQKKGTKARRQFISRIDRTVRRYMNTYG